MDAVLYLKERRRMCTSYVECKDCPFTHKDECNDCEILTPEKAVEIVSQWSADHPEQGA